MLVNILLRDQRLEESIICNDNGNWYNKGTIDNRGVNEDNKYKYCDCSYRESWS